MFCLFSSEDANEFSIAFDHILNRYIAILLYQSYIFTHEVKLSGDDCMDARRPTCLVGAYCSHAVLTVKIGVYSCPFGECFKKLESQKRGGS